MFAAVANFVGTFVGICRHDERRYQHVPLTDIAVRNAKASERPKKLADGGGLHLLLTPAGGKLWRVSYRFAGKQKTLALGRIPM
jgi:hypothetical protein